MDIWATVRRECYLKPSYRHTAGTCCTGHSMQGKKLRCEDVTIIFQIAWMAIRMEMEEWEIDQENVESFPVAELIGRSLCQSISTRLAVVLVCSSEILFLDFQFPNHLMTHLSQRIHICSGLWEANITWTKSCWIQCSMACQSPGGDCM